MSTIDLIILGFLLEREMSAYELATFIVDRQIYRFLKISTPAVYKRCKKLFEDGYLNGKTFKEGLYPEKNVYKINDKGKEHFAELMEHFSTNVPHIYLDMNAFIWNIENLNYEDGLKHLNNLKSELNSIKYWISQHEKEVENHLDFAGRSIVRQHRMMIDTLYEWIEGVIVEFNNRKENE